jgi:hypothetical protein
MVAARGQRQLVHEALRGKDLRIVARRAPGAGGDPQREHRLGAAQVGRLDRIFEVVCKVGPRGLFLAVGRKGDEVLLPGVEAASLVDRALELVIAGGSVEVVAEIVFPAPLQLDRSVDLHGDRRGLAGIVVDQPPPETAADAGLVHHDLLRRNAGNLAYKRQAAIRLLCRHP